jgi:magnesium-protoporphyrin O-methyltransferase
MDCCQRVGIEDFFTPKIASLDLKRYRRKGPDKNTRILLDALKAEGVESMSLLDIGGGIGAIQHELIKHGASKATSIDVSKAYLEASRKEADRQGHADRINHVQGDFIELAEDIPQADIVTLDRVICCYDDMQALVSLSADRAAKLYGVIYPRDHWFSKALLVLENAYYRLRRSQFRAYVHATAAVDALVRAAGLEPFFYRQTLYWQVVVYRR